MTVEYQTLYIDSAADSWEDRIILFRETFPDPTTNQVILQSLDFMDKPAVIICGVQEELNTFAKLMAKADQKHKIGNMPLKDIYGHICKIAEESKVKIVFVQNVPAGGQSE